MEFHAMDTIGIGTLAKRAGVSIDTVRYYEKSGLLTPHARLAEVNRRIASLQRVRNALSELIAKCPGHGRAADCPILKALGERTVK